MIAPLCFVVVEILSFENIILGVYQYIACEQAHLCEFAENVDYLLCFYLLVS